MDVYLYWKKKRKFAFEKKMKAFVVVLLLVLVASAQNFTYPSNETDSNITNDTDSNFTFPYDDPNVTDPSFYPPKVPAGLDETSLAIVILGAVIFAIILGTFLFFCWTWRNNKNLRSQSANENNFLLSNSIQVSYTKA